MTEGLPLVSVVTPSYNQGQFIEEAILSIKTQSYPKIEHIVVDAGSADNTVEVLARYESTYNLRWLSEPDNGMYEAINKGFSLSRGDILAYLNCDDLYLPWTIEVVVNYFRTHTDVDLIYGDLIAWNCDTNVVALWLYPPPRLASLRRTWFIAQPTVFMRRKVWQEIGPFDTSLKLVADCDFWMRVDERFNVRRINEFLAVVKIHLLSQSSRKQSELRQEIGYVRSRYVREEGLRLKLLRMFDKIYAYSWRRACLLRFALAAARAQKRRATDLTKVPWRRFLAAHPLRVQSWSRLFLGVLPGCDPSLGFDINLKWLRASGGHVESYAEFAEADVPPGSH